MSLKTFLEKNEKKTADTHTLLATWRHPACQHTTGDVATANLETYSQPRVCVGLACEAGGQSNYKTTTPTRRALLMWRSSRSCVTVALTLLSSEFCAGIGSNVISSRAFTSTLRGQGLVPKADTTMTVIMVDTTNALAVLGAQVDDMLQKNSTHVAFCLASPSNRRATARGGYDSKTFDTMVRGPSYAPLLGKGGGSYQVLSSSQTGSNFEASVKIVQADGSSKNFDFGMSLQQASVVDENASLEPYQLRPGHPPVWRTDMVMPSRR